TPEYNLVDEQVCVRGTCDAGSGVQPALSGRCTYGGTSADEHRLGASTTRTRATPRRPGLRLLCRAERADRASPERLGGQRAEVRPERGLEDRQQLPHGAAGHHL